MFASGGKHCSRTKRYRNAPQLKTCNHRLQMRIAQKARGYELRRRFSRIAIHVFKSTKIDYQSNMPSFHPAAAIRAEAGIVKTHAITIFCATPQCTARARVAEPTPTIAPVIVCVVDTGIPNTETKRMVIAPPVSAANPPTGFSFVMRCPIVLTIRQPPNNVPSPIAAKQL
jgi:hypothetical protein